MARLGIAFPLGMLTWMIALYFVNINFWMAIGIGFLAGVVPFYIIKWFQYRSVLKSHGLSAQEYQYIQTNLKESQKKIVMLTQFILNLQFHH